jgi:hypothetical protein
MNPELLRNLWLQFSPQRIIAAPLILGAVFALIASATDSWELVGRVANVGFVVIAYLWGTRRAVNALADEITAGTWDGQRMSSIAPWSMAWGKLIGGTAYVWYCALLCLATYAAAELEIWRQSELFIALPIEIIGALLVQAVALSFALMLVGKGRRLSRRSVAAQGAACSSACPVAAVWLPSMEHPGSRRPRDHVVRYRVLGRWLHIVDAGSAGQSRASSPDGGRSAVWQPWVWLSSLFLIAYYRAPRPGAGLSLRFFLVSVAAPTISPSRNRTTSSAIAGCSIICVAGLRAMRWRCCRCGCRASRWPPGWPSLSPCSPRARCGP